MVTDRVERRLAAILAADVAGYSRLMGSDEEGTLNRLKAHRRELIDPKIAEHRGRIVKTTGDGMLVEFPSVVDAVRCAIEVQQRMRERNADVPQEHRIEFRVGINLGDIIIDDDDIHGDGVNIAARLEALAEPGSVYASSAAWDQARDKVPIAADDLGEYNLKNIQHLVRVFRIAGAASPKSRSPASHASEKASVAVLPFQNMTADAEIEHFADGLTEDIITALSHIRALSVVARNSTFAYKGRSIDIRQAGRSLAARYVLEGSVRKSGSRVRVTAQLIEAETGHHIWAEKMDREIVDIFELQDDFTRSVVASTQTQLILIEGEHAGHSDRSRAQVHDLLTLAQRRMYELTPEALQDVRSLVEQALAIDPASGFACRMMALAIWHLGYLGCLPIDDTMVQQALHFGRRSVQARDADEYCYWALSLAHLLAKDHDQAFATLDRALEINPNCSLAIGSKGTILAWAGDDDAIKYIKLCIQADPRNPSIFFRYFGWALVAYCHSRYREAAENASKVTQIRPDWWLGLTVAAASYAQARAMTEAHRAISDLLRIKPDLKVASLGALPFKHAKDLDHLVEGLLKAGLPE